MASNTPIIAAFDTDSELAEVIAKANAGDTVEPEDADKLATAIGDMADSGAQSFTGGREYTLTNASKETCTVKYVNILKESIK
jgi:glycosyltransferase involved in cell wall biosynthesis